MKLKVNWKELARQLWAAIRSVLLGAISGGESRLAGTLALPVGRQNAP